MTFRVSFLAVAVLAVCSTTTTTASLRGKRIDPAISDITNVDTSVFSNAAAPTPLTLGGGGGLAAMGLGSINDGTFGAVNPSAPFQSLAAALPSTPEAEMFAEINRDQQMLQAKKLLVSRQDDSISDSETSLEKLKNMINENKAILHKNQQSLKSASKALVDLIKHYETTLLATEEKEVEDVDAAEETDDGETADGVDDDEDSTDDDQSVVDAKGTEKAAADEQLLEAEDAKTDADMKVQEAAEIKEGEAEEQKELKDDDATAVADADAAAEDPAASDAVAVSDAAPKFREVRKINKNKAHKKHSSSSSESVANRKQELTRRIAKLKRQLAKSKEPVGTFYN